MVRLRGSAQIFGARFVRGRCTARAGPKRKKGKKDEQEKKAKRLDRTRTRRAKDGERGSECEIGEKEEDRGWKRRRTDERTWPGHVTAATTEDINQRAHCARG